MKKVVLLFQIAILMWMAAGTAFADNCCEHDETASSNIETTAHTDSAVNDSYDQDCDCDKESCNDQQCCPNSLSFLVTDPNLLCASEQEPFRSEYLFRIPDLVMPVLIRPPIA